MERAFLYIDILGFSEMVNMKSPKISQIFEIIDTLSSFRHFAFTTILFSDTILIFNKNCKLQTHYHITFLIEFAQQLFYRLLRIGVYYRGIITYGEFNFNRLTNIQAYWGNALLETHQDESTLDGLGLFVKNDLVTSILTFKTKMINDKYSFVFLCQSYIRLYTNTKGNLPVDYECLIGTDDYCDLDKELAFFREIEWLKTYYPSYIIRRKYSTVYNWYKEETPLFFSIFEKEGFLPFIINHNYSGTINPFELISEKEFKNKQL